MFCSILMQQLAAEIAAVFIVVIVFIRLSECNSSLIENHIFVIN